MTCAVALGVEGGTESSVIRHAEGIRSLSYEMASRHLPVKLRGVITYRHEYFGFIQDETGGVYFEPQDAEVLPAGRSEDLKPGTLVELEGSTIPGRYAPCVGRDVRIRVLGTAPLPTPVQVPSIQLLQPEFDMQWVEVIATVMGTHIDDELLRLDLVANGSRFTADVLDDWKDDPMLGRLMGSDIRIRGVYGGLPNRRRQLVAMQVLCPSTKHIEILDEGLKTAFASPYSDVSKLLQYRPDHDRRVKVRGRLLASFNDQRFFLRSRKGAIEIQTANPHALTLGHEIVAVGFPVLKEGHVVLRDAVMRTIQDTRNIQETPPPSAIEFRGDRLSLSAMHGELVSLTGVVVEHFDRLPDPVALLDSSQGLFTVTLPRNLKPIAPQTRVLVAGICLVNSPSNLLPAYDRDSGLLIEPTQVDYAFTIKTRGESDVAILQKPSWWTRERLQAIGTVLGLGVVATMVWVLALRRRVREQTRIIAEKIEKQRLTEERVRIASELHDTLEQEWVGIGLQLENALARLKTSPTRAGESIILARTMLRQSQAEARSTIWDLHCETRTRENMLSSLRQIANHLQSDQGPVFSVEVAEDIQVLRGTVANHFLRVAQEAVTNAIKHARARKVEIVLSKRDNELRLEIKDDGIGFDTQSRAASPEGHFGLSGMKQRASKLKGSLVVQSQPGLGTTLTLATRIP
jgi:signal transduction histidine kinase